MCVLQITVLQNVIFCAFFVLGLVGGGAGSAANAAHVNDGLDELGCNDFDELPVVYQQFIEEICDDGEQIRDCQIASAVSQSKCLPTYRSICNIHMQISIIIWV